MSHEPMNKYYAEKLAARYFIVSERQFKHLHGCKINSKKKFCTCGLIHDLLGLDYPFAAIIHPEFYKEFLQQERVESIAKIKLKGKQIWLQNTFCSDKRANITDIKKIYDEFREVAKQLFPRKTDCPKVYLRLEKWLEEQLAKPT